MVSTSDPTAWRAQTALDLPRLQLQTARLTLRPLREDDLDDMSGLLGGRDALVLWSEPLDREGLVGGSSATSFGTTPKGLGRCAVILRSTGELVGDCGLIQTAVEDVPEVELGWIVATTHWGDCIATEAGRAWRDYALTRFDLQRIVPVISEENVASRRVAEKLGMAVDRPAIWDGCSC